MTYHNGKLHKIEGSVPGVPRINHLLMQRACDAFLASRGLVTAPSFRRSEWLYGRPAMKRRSA